MLIELKGDPAYGVGADASQVLGEGASAAEDEVKRPEKQDMNVRARARAMESRHIAEGRSYIGRLVGGGRMKNLPEKSGSSPAAEQLQGSVVACHNDHALTGHRRR